MPRIPTAEVSKEELECLFNELHIWNKICNGQLSWEPKTGTDTPSYSWPTATSWIIKHCSADGKHIATTHCVIDDTSGLLLHWDAKDLRVRNVCLWRL